MCEYKTQCGNCKYWESMYHLKNPSLEIVASDNIFLKIIHYFRLKRFYKRNKIKIKYFVIGECMLLDNNINGMNSLLTYHYNKCNLHKFEELENIESEYLEKIS